MILPLFIVSSLSEIIFSRTSDFTYCEAAQRLRGTDLLQRFGAKQRPLLNCAAKELDKPLGTARSPTRKQKCTLCMITQA